MPVTLNSVDAADRAREKRWSEFLGSLRPWELHALLRLESFGDSMELFLHDQFIDREITLQDVRIVLAAELSE